MKTQLIELNEKDLQLIVSDKELGHLTTNAHQIKQFVESVLPKYSIENYNEDNIDEAKKDKALLNGAKKMLNDKRIEIEREFQKPFAEFKATITATCSMIADCVSKIDSVVKESEQKAKDEKKVEIINYFDSKNFNLVPITKIFDEKWLNKTTSMKSIKTEIDSKIEQIETDIDTLKTFGDDADLIQSIYLENLNIGHAIQYGNRLKENKAKIQETESKPEPEQAPKKPAPVASKKSSAKPEILIRAFRVKTTREKIIALSEFMNQNGIEFEKIDQ